MKRNLFIVIGIFSLIIFIIPPIQPAPYTIDNRGWDGLSEFKKNIISQQIKVTETTIPLRLLGNINRYEAVIVVGGSLPYFKEDSTFLFQYVKQGGTVIIFEDHGYSRILTSSFGISLGGTVIDQDNHFMNPYQPVVIQEDYFSTEHNFSSYEVVFNRAVSVSQSIAVEGTTYYPLFSTQGSTWEDKNNDGQFYRDGEHLKSPCYLGGLLEFKDSGKVIIIGDSAFPTNDLIDQKENKAFLLDIIKFLVSDRTKSILFDESRKLWIPPTGKSAIGLSSVIIMGLFHSPIISISILIIIAGIISIKKQEQSVSFLQKVRTATIRKLEKPVAAYLQSEEEEEISRLWKSSVTSNFYRSLIADEIRSHSSTLNLDEQIKLEKFLHKRYLNVRDYYKVQDLLNKSIGE